MKDLVAEAMAHIWPVFRVRDPGGGQNMQPLEFCGTGFIIVGGFFITCWHCVSGPLRSDESYAAAYPAPNSP
jgi:hypothetical protein